MPLKVIVLTGLPGSGKTTVAKFLKRQGFRVIHMGRLTRLILDEAGFVRNEDNERIVRNYLRDKYGKDIYAREILKEINHQRDYGNPVVIEGLRSLEELNLFRKYFPGLLVIFLESKDEIRYQRLGMRKERPITREEVRQRDKEEIDVLGLERVKKAAHYLIPNNAEKGELYQNIKGILSERK